MDLYNFIATSNILKSQNIGIPNCYPIDSFQNL